MSVNWFQTRTPFFGLAAMVLAGALAWSQDKPAPVEERVSALIEKLETQNKEYGEARKAAKTPEEKDAAAAKSPDLAAYARDFKKLALEAGKTDVAAKAWVNVVMCAGRVGDDAMKTLAGEGVKTLFSEHMDSEHTLEILDAAPYFLGPLEGERALQGLVDKSKNRTTQSAALLALTDIWIEASDEASLGKAKQGLERLGKEYGAEKDPSSRSGETFEKTSQKKLEMLQKFGIGASAPEIEGEDISGVKFKLSDYRGKVVLLDFWGNW